MTTVGDMIDEDIPQSPTEQAVQAGETGQQVQGQAAGGGKKSIVDYLTAKSPNKPVETYMDSSLNVFGTEWFGRILRGFEGILGESFSDYAVFDIMRGSYEGFFKSKGSESSRGEKDAGHKEESAE